MGARDSSGGRAPRFLLDGRVVEATDAGPATTLLQYLRGPLGRCGTKEGCAEGDCGACTVVVGEPRDGTMRWRAVNSCIRFVGTLDGKEVVTVESLRAPDGTLHPVQQAMVDAHGSQCGFCTPGFVMSLFALYLEREAVTREEATTALSGNLCRCTGYRPILDAAMRMHSLPAPAHWSRNAARAPERVETLTRLASDRDAATLPGFVAPRTIEALAAALVAAPDSLLLAGGTDIGLWSTKQLRELPPIVYLGDVEGLEAIRESAPALEIGAAASLADAYAAIVARYPMLRELAERFGSVPVRNSGTLCGNLGNGSPIGDSMPVLIALGATLVLRHGDRERELPLEAFYRKYRVTALERGEFIRAVRVPLPDGRRVASYKVSKRVDQDISAVCGGFALRLGADGRVVEARIAYGGMAEIPKRATNAEGALAGRPFNLEAVRAAQVALARDFTPLDDFRASAAYRLQVAGALLERFLHETQGTHAVLRVAEADPA